MTENHLRKLVDRMVQPVGLGCMNLNWAYGDPPEHAERVRLLNEALDLGYDHLDTASIYGVGANEELINEAVMHRRDEFLLASKCGIKIEGRNRSIDCSPQSIATTLDESLKRLGTDTIDLYYMHRFDPKVPIADSVGAMSRAIEQGKIRSYGVSEWSAAHIREAHAIAPMAAVQTEYSLWTRNPELGVLETTSELGIAFVAFSPVGRGALAGGLSDPETLGQQDIRRTMPRFSADNWPANRALIAQFDAVATREGMTPAQLALAWLLARNDHVHVIPGTKDIDHMRENFAARTIAPGDAVLEEVGALINQQTVSGHRYSDAMNASIDTEDYG